MLATLAEFPHPGSIAWLRQTPDHADGPAPAEAGVEQVRILRDNADGTRLIAFASTGSFRHPASGNKTVPAADLFASRDQALAPKPARKPRKMARPVRQPDYAALGLTDPEGRN